ncbi:hypothetical protein DRP04_06125 [Archaeoglobales archaeon]|nr:MAG: hypothetical protein DRP04_06125 [Archaeoglobales archaeon]
MDEVLLSFKEKSRIVDKYFLSHTFYIKWTDEQLVNIGTISPSFVAEEISKMANIIRLKDLDEDLAYFFTTLTYGWSKFRTKTEPYIFFKKKFDKEKLWKALINSLGVFYSCRKKENSEDIHLEVVFHCRSGFYTIRELFVRTKNMSEFIEKTLSLVKITEREIRRSETRVYKSYRIGANKEDLVKFAKIYLILDTIAEIHYSSIGYVQEYVDLFSLLLEDEKFLESVDLILRLVVINPTVWENIKNLINLLESTPPEKRVRLLLSLLAVM